MNSSLLTGLFTVLLLSVSAQQSETFGLIRKNYYSTVSDPIDTAITYEQLDSSTIRLGKIDPELGTITNLGTPFMGAINLTGAALNPYNNTYIFQGAQLHSLDLATGEIINSVAISNPIQASYFDNFRFNNADTTLYGLARRNTYDPVTQTNNGEVYLAKIDAISGVITQISPNSVAQGYALAGSAIDPHQMVFYFSTGANLMGLDLYTGEIYSNPIISIQDGIAFDNFAYSCADTTIYGLVRQNYMSNVYDPVLGEWTSVLDSATVRLGKIDATTGIVTIISPNAVTYGGYTLNGGATIDPNEMIYYYSTGTNLVGVSLVTGLMVTNVPYNGQDGQYFDLIRNVDDCKNAQAARLNDGSLGTGILANVSDIMVFPNPADEQITLRSNEPIQHVRIIDNSGREIASYQFNEAGEITLSVQQLNSGIYWVVVNDLQRVNLFVK